MSGTRDRDDGERTAIMSTDQLRGLLDENKQARTMPIATSELEDLLDDSREQETIRLAHVIPAEAKGDPDDMATVVERPPAAPSEKQSETVQLDARDLAKLLKEP